MLVLDLRKQVGISAIHSASYQKVSQKIVFSLLQQTLGEFKCDSARGSHLRSKIVHEHWEPVFELQSSLRGKSSHGFHPRWYVIRRIYPRRGYGLCFGV